MTSAAELLGVAQLVTTYRSPGGAWWRPGRPRNVRAVDGVDLVVREGETVGLVGESGCGKSTLARTIAGLVPAASGRISFAGEPLSLTPADRRRSDRRHLQIVFQNPYGSLNPRLRVGDLISEPLKAHGLEKRRNMDRRVRELMVQVGLDPSFVDRYPHQLSGGQRQRVSIGRALILGPRLLILDEPVSALDVSVQAQILNLLREVQQQLGLAYLFISHDLAVVRSLAQSLAVMYLGKVVESGPADDIYEQPVHPYTKLLLASVPVPDPRQRDRPRPATRAGDLPSPLDPPGGCAFHPRCWKATDICSRVVPALEQRAGVPHLSACHHAATDRELGT